MSHEQLLCPLCNSIILWNYCEHPLERQDGALYYVAYAKDGTTLVIKNAPFEDNIGRSHKLILTLDGFHILTMDRVNKLLLFK